MDTPTQAQIDSLLSKLTEEEDRKIFLGLQALLVASQTQNIMYAQALDRVGSLAGEIALDIGSATQQLTNLANSGNEASDTSLKALRSAYQNADGGVQGGMAAAEGFLKVYKNQSEKPNVNPGSLFKTVASGFLNMALPGASSIFRLLG